MTLGPRVDELREVDEDGLREERVGRADGRQVRGTRGPRGPRRETVGFSRTLRCSAPDLAMRMTTITTTISHRDADDRMREHQPEEKPDEAEDQPGVAAVASAAPPPPPE